MNDQTQQQSEYQYRVRINKPPPADWPWEDDLDLVKEEADCFAALGAEGVRIEVRLRPIPGNRGDYEIVWDLGED